MWAALVSGTLAYGQQGTVEVSLGYAGVGAAGAVEEAAAGAGVAGSAYLGFRVLDRLTIDVGGREGVMTGDLRIVGTIQLGLRYDLGEHLFVRGGFVHHHESPWGGYKDNVITATLGSWEGIRHRSGGDLGLGLSWDLPLGSVPVSTSIEASAVAFPDPSGPPVYGVFQHLFTMHLGG